MQKKILSFLLAVLMLASLMPMTVFATSGTDAGMLDLVNSSANANGQFSALKASVRVLSDGYFIIQYDMTLSNDYLQQKIGAVEDGVKAGTLTKDNFPVRSDYASDELYHDAVNYYNDTFYSNLDNDILPAIEISLAHDKDMFSVPSEAEAVDLKYTSSSGEEKIGTGDLSKDANGNIVLNCKFDKRVYNRCGVTVSFSVGYLNKSDLENFEPIWDAEKSLISGQAATPSTPTAEVSVTGAEGEVTHEMVSLEEYTRFNASDILQLDDKYEGHEGIPLVAENSSKVIAAGTVRCGDSKVNSITGKTTLTVTFPKDSYDPNTQQLVVKAYGPYNNGYDYYFEYYYPEVTVSVDNATITVTYDGVMDWVLAAIDKNVQVLNFREEAHAKTVETYTNGETAGDEKVSIYKTTYFWEDSYDNSYQYRVYYYQLDYFFYYDKSEQTVTKTKIDHTFDETYVTPYTTDDHGNMAYNRYKNEWFGSDLFDLIGKLGGDWKSVTYENSGFETYLKIGDKIIVVNDLSGSNKVTYWDSDKRENVEIDMKVGVQCDIVGDDGHLVKVTYTVENVSGEAKTFSLGSGADITIGNDDYAPISALKNDNDEQIGLSMTSTQHCDRDADGNYATLALVCMNNGLVDDVDTLWYGLCYGYYNDEKMFGGSVKTDTYDEDDSGLSYSWIDETLEAGATKTYSVLFGVGDIEKIMADVEAAAPAHDLTVTKVVESEVVAATEGTDYAWDDADTNKLLIKANGLTVSGTTTTEYIEVDEGVTDLTIKDLSITNSDNKKAIIFMVDSNACILTVLGTNELVSSAFDVLYFISSATITGEGNLSVISSDRDNGEAICGEQSLTLDCSGTITALGGTGVAAGIYAYGGLSVTANTGKILVSGSNTDLGAIAWDENTLTLANGLVMTASADYNVPEASITGEATIDDNCITTVGSVAKSVLITGAEESIAAYHLRTRTTDSTPRRLMGRQGKWVEGKTFSSTVGRTIIPLTEEQCKSSDKLVVVGYDGRKAVNIETSDAYTYFYNYNAETGQNDMIKATDKGYYAFIIFDNDGTQGEDNTITGYGYYRLYNGSYDESNPQKNFLFDVLFANDN